MSGWLTNIVSTFVICSVAVVGYKWITNRWKHAYLAIEELRTVQPIQYKVNCFAAFWCSPLDATEEVTSDVKSISFISDKVTIGEVYGKLQCARGPGELVVIDRTSERFVSSSSKDSVLLSTVPINS